MKILGIESSCDETGAAIVEARMSVRSSVVATQDEVHARYGGVVPELASRRHVASILPVIEEALERAGLTIQDIDGIAVTKGPGLVGSLLVGVSMAKSISYALNIPIVGVNHIEGHLASIFLNEEKQPDFPFIGLVASGGHTSLFFVPEFGNYKLIGETRDDAAGEAFDKVGKLCKLPYPGGPHLDRISKDGDPTAIEFPRPSMPGLDFSFSGLKTAAALWIRKHGVPNGKTLCDLAASFQEAVIESLMEKLFEAAEDRDIHRIAVCGGVAQNRRLRASLENEVKRRDLELFLAPPSYCTDNAAMIAVAGYAQLERGDRDNLSLNAVATMPFA